MMCTRRMWCRAVLIVVFTLFTSSALLERALAGPPPPRKTFNQGRRWIGLASKCEAPNGWLAEALFAAPQPPGTSGMCVYTWLSSPQPPSSGNLTTLFAVSGATAMVEDVPVVVPMTPTFGPTSAEATWSPAEVAFFGGLRSAFLQQVGTAEVLRPWPVQTWARIAVIDSAPTARACSIINGAGSRHGDTLAHLIEDIVCVPSMDGGRVCAAEVTSELALPWLSPSLSTPDGGHSGTPVDLARAIYGATRRWEMDRSSNPATPPRLILNLSVGWEHTPRIADCYSDPTTPVDLPARAVQGALQYAADRNVIIIAAAGNDSGGPSPRSGLTCPGAYQAMAQQANPNASLLTAVSGVDYSDRPLESARSQGHTGIVALAFAGVAWSPGEPAPPSLVGSSVATAVVSALSALVLAVQPSWSAASVMQTIHAGGAVVNTPAEACPLGFAHCVTRRANVCGALTAAGAAPFCSVAPAKGWSSPSLPLEISQLTASVVPQMRSAAFAPLYKDPRFLLPSMQVEPWTFPMPISATCPTCWVSESMAMAMAAPPSTTSSLSTMSAPDQLTIPALGRPLQIPMLLVHLDDDSWLGIELQGPLSENVSYRFNLPPLPPVRAAYLAGFDWQEQHSIFEQVFVHR